MIVVIDILIMTTSHCFLGCKGHNFHQCQLQSSSLTNKCFPSTQCHASILHIGIVLVVIGSLWPIMGLLQLCKKGEPLPNSVVIPRSNYRNYNKGIHQNVFSLFAFRGSMLFHLGTMYVFKHPMLPCMHSKCLGCIHFIFNENKFVHLSLCIPLL